MRVQIVFFLLLTSLLQSCLILKPVEFRRAENFSLTTVNNAPLLNFGLVFKNPNRFGCKIADIHLEGAVNSQQL